MDAGGSQGRVERPEMGVGAFVTAGDYATILSAVAVVIGQITTAYVLVAKSQRDAAEAREDRRRRDLNLTQHLEAQDTKLAEVHDLTKKVQVETNGMKAQLVEEVRKASFAKGVKSETDKVGEGPAERKRIDSE